MCIRDRYNREEFDALVRSGLDQSPVTEVLLEESIIGWKEYEMEVMRHMDDNVVIICAIENFDPMGVHTGDSITVAPAQTLTDKEYQRMYMQLENYVHQKIKLEKIKNDFSCKISSPFICETKFNYKITNSGIQET